MQGVERARYERNADMAQVATETHVHTTRLVGADRHRSPGDAGDAGRERRGDRGDHALDRLRVDDGPCSGELRVDERHLDEGLVDDGFVVAVGDGDQHPLGPGDDGGSLDDARSHERGCRSGRGAVERGGKDIVRTGGDRDHGDLGPAERDIATGAVAAEDDHDPAPPRGELRRCASGIEA